MIGIDASRAFIKNRTGIEEYSYQVIKHLRKYLKKEDVFLYLRKGQRVDFGLPPGWRTKTIRFPFLWTQVGLSLEMLLRPVDILFVPAHVLPIFSPKKSVVVVHGLEYEVFPEGYSFLDRLYMRWSIKFSCWKAKKIIAVSKNTKKDLAELYKIYEDKIAVVYEGVSEKFQTKSKVQISNIKPYLLFIGRLEKRKNVGGIIKAFEILKERYKIKHKLVLAGRSGYGWEDIKSQIANSKYGREIVLTGFISEEEKYRLLENADVFLFPTFYEGFGLPVLEAQVVGTPVVTSNISSLPEVGNESVAYCDPNEAKTIADAIYAMVSDEIYRNDIIRKGYKNTKRFSWDRCASQTAEIFLDK